jgi:hypothetical protein
MQWPSSTPRSPITARRSGRRRVVSPPGRSDIHARPPAWRRPTSPATSWRAAAPTRASPPASGHCVAPRSPTARGCWHGLLDHQRATGGDQIGAAAAFQRWVTGDDRALYLWEPDGASHGRWSAIARLACASPQRAYHLRHNAAGMALPPSCASAGRSLPTGTRPGICSPTPMASPRGGSAAAPASSSPASSASSAGRDHRPVRHPDGRPRPGVVRRPPRSSAARPRRHRGAGVVGWGP